MSSFENSKKIIKDKFEIPENQFCKINFGFKRNDGEPLSLEKINSFSDDLVKVFEKHEMDWKIY